MNRRSSDILKAALAIFLLSTTGAFAKADNLYSWKLSGSSLAIESDGKPLTKSFQFSQDGEHYYILEFRHAVLLGPSQVLETREPHATVIEVSQFTTHPDVVHIVVRQKNPSVFSLETQPKGDSYHLRLDWQSKSPAPRAPAPHVKVFLDVGHGGYDPGGTGPDGLPESFVNLDVAEKVASILRAHGVAVELDRTTNTFVSLPERVSLVNQSHADLCVGLYCNASKDRSLHGTTTYYFHSDAQAFARYLGQQVARALGLADNGTLHDDLYVIKNSTDRIPDVIIEYAYISNYSEEALLSSSDFRDRIASAVAAAILNYTGKKTFDPTDGR
ncbi:MAG: N-acetylmuramoyl-L-alanine amidase [Spirochaetales bacterium]|nr:N-acetylmuramoyl-L-alanine amidase [Spirochaetales bacterium]